jgi:hypothetical protein
LEIRDALWSIKLQDWGDVNNYASLIDPKVKDYNRCAVPSTTDSDATDTDSANIVAKMSEQEDFVYLLRGIPKNDKWKVFLELMMDKNATITTTHNELVTKLFEKEAAIKRENDLAPEALLFRKMGGKGGNGGKAGKGSKSPKRDRRNDKRDNKGDTDRKDKDFRKCYHCQPRRHTTKNCLSKTRGNPPKAPETAAKASIETMSTVTISIENFGMRASSSASSSG